MREMDSMDSMLESWIEDRLERMAAGPWRDGADGGGKGEEEKQIWIKGVKCSVVYRNVAKRGVMSECMHACVNRRGKRRSREEWK